MPGPAFTVIIPTRERADVLDKSLRTVVAQNYDDLEILVSDNCSVDDTEDVVRGVNDPRIKYIRTPGRLSMSHNWEYALSAARGNWITIIGDDDGLLPGSIRHAADLIQVHGVEAIRSRVCAYTWPSLTGRGHGVLKVPLKQGCELRKSAIWLARVLAGNAPYVDLPMLYNGGFVKRSALDRIKHKTGSYYRSSIPDVYSAVAVSSVVESYVYCHEPLAINGASKHSTGTSYFTQTPNQGLSPAELFHSEDVIPFHEDLPLSKSRFPKSLQAMVFESFLQSEGLRPPTQQRLYAQQLEVILAGEPGGDYSLEDWAVAFAGQHALDYPRIKSQALRRRQLSRLRVLRNDIFEEMNTFLIDCPQIRLADVYDASIAAGAILRLHQSRSNGLQILARHIARRLSLHNMTA
jgi:glycosyltransferase involved in cell wall biosynthesis